MSKIERRNFVADELRVSKDGETRKIEGHAAVFNQLSEDLGFFKEKIAPGAFKNANKQDVRALFNHDPNFVLGRNTAGTLKMEEDKTGLKVQIDPPDTSFARDLSVSIDRGDISQMSFGFRVVKESWDKGKDGALDTRTLEEVDLFDVSPVTFPAYPQTDVGVRSLSEISESRKEFFKESEPEKKPGKMELNKRKQKQAEYLVNQ